MVVSLRPGHWFPIAGSVPQRRRVIIIGATEAGVAAAFHLGESALLLEQEKSSGAERPALYEVVTDQGGVRVVKRWEPPSCTDFVRELMNLSSAETLLGTRVTSIDVYEHRLEVATGASFVYDKLVSTLRTGELFPLIMEQMPRRIHSVESLRTWLDTRDIELLDTATQLVSGDVDGQAAGKRVADSIQREMAVKYSATKGLFQPRLVSALV